MYKQVIAQGLYTNYLNFLEKLWSKINILLQNEAKMFKKEKR